MNVGERGLRSIVDAAPRVGRRLSFPSTVVLVSSAVLLTAAWTASAASTPSGKQLDVATKGFGLHMKLTLTKRWHVLPSDPQGSPPSEAIGLVHVGTHPSDESHWWGPDIMIVNGARVHRPADAVSQQPATPDSSKFVPWPSDFFGYLSSLPGVKVIASPKPVTIGGIRGSQFTVQTPPMHPIIWLKSDTAWIGGGPSGVDPAMTRRIILVNVKGKMLFLGFADTAANFKKRWPMVHQLFGSIRF
jgi:hypothetical protein